MQAFEADVRRRFVAASIDRLRARHGFDEAKARDVVESALERASILGLDEESDAVTLMDWYAEHGVGFEERPGREVVKHTLEDRTLPGWARLKLAARSLNGR